MNQLWRALAIVGYTAGMVEELRLFIHPELFALTFGPEELFLRVIRFAEVVECKKVKEQVFQLFTGEG